MRRYVWIVLIVAFVVLIAWLEGHQPERVIDGSLETLAMAY